MVTVKNQLLLCICLTSKDKGGLMSAPAHL